MAGSPFYQTSRTSTTKLYEQGREAVWYQTEVEGLEPFGRGSCCFFFFLDSIKVHLGVHDPMWHWYITLVYCVLFPCSSNRYTSQLTPPHAC